MNKLNAHLDLYIIVFLFLFYNIIFIIEKFKIMSNNMFGRSPQSAYGSSNNSNNYNSNNYSSGSYGNSSYNNYRQNNSNSQNPKIGSYRVRDYDPDKFANILPRTQQYK
jgi:hypothetical protein